MWGSVVMRFIGRSCNYLCKNKTILIVSLVVVAYLTAPRIFTRQRMLTGARTHARLTGLNCPPDEAVMSIKTDEMWESRVVKVKLKL